MLVISNSWRSGSRGGLCGSDIGAADNWEVGSSALYYHLTNDTHYCYLVSFDAVDVETFGQSGRVCGIYASECYDKGHVGVGSLSLTKIIMLEITIQLVLVSQM